MRARNSSRRPSSPFLFRCTKEREREREYNEKGNGNVRANVHLHSFYFLGESCRQITRSFIPRLSYRAIIKLRVGYPPVFIYLSSVSMKNIRECKNRYCWNKVQSYRDSFNSIFYFMLDIIDSFRVNAQYIDYFVHKLLVLIINILVSSRGD